MLTCSACAACRPAHALFFAIYELAKDALGGNEARHCPIATAVAGFTATFVNDGVMTPAVVVTQQLQVANSPYRGMTDCILRISREESIPAFFKSYRTTVSLTRNALRAFLEAGYSLLSKALYDWGFVQAIKTTVCSCLSCHAQ